MKCPGDDAIVRALPLMVVDSCDNGFVGFTTPLVAGKASPKPVDLFPKEDGGRVQ